MVGLQMQGKGSDQAVVVGRKEVGPFSIDKWVPFRLTDFTR
jgi:hypothetical protein